MESGKPAGRAQLARAVTSMIKAKGHLLLDSAPNVVLALVAGCALAPIAASAAGIGGVDGAILTAVGGVGTNAVSDLLMGAIERWRRHNRGAPEAAELADAITGDILAAFRREGGLASDFASQLVLEVEALGGFDAALGAAGGELRDYLTVCFGELRAGQQQVLDAVLEVRNEQLRQRAEQLRQRAGVEEAVDRLRRLSRSGGDSGDGPSAAPLIAIPVPMARGQAPEAAEAEAWRAGAEVMVGDRLYLLHGDLLAEYPDPDRPLVRRLAMARPAHPSAPSRRLRLAAPGRSCLQRREHRAARRHGKS